MRGIARWEQGRVTRRAVLAVPLLAGLATFGGCSRGGDSSPSIPTPNTDAFVAWPEKNIWPQALLEMPEAVQANYYAAVPNKALLQWIPCYCGCYATGHTSVYDCYVEEERPDGSIVIDTMSFGWGICNDVARDAMTMHQEGRKIAEIRRIIEETYRAFGQPTDAPVPPEDL